MRPGPPAGRGGWGRGRRQEERGGSRGRRQQRGADSAAVGGGGGDSGFRALAVEPGSGTQAVAEAAAEEGTGAGAGERGGSHRTREGRWLAPGESRGGSDSDRGERGTGGGSGGHGGPCPCAPAATGRGPARWSRSTCVPRSQPAARPGRNRWVPRPCPPLPLVLAHCPPPPTPGPGSVQEAVRDEVPSCFPAGAALPPAPGLLLARRPERLCPVGWSSSPRGLWRRSFEDRFRASSASQLCTSFPSVARRLGERRRRGRAVSGWRREETGLTS